MSPPGLVPWREAPRVKTMAWLGAWGFVASCASAQPMAWNNPAGGCWCAPGNWMPTGLPASFNTVQIGLPGTYTVRLGTVGTSSAAALSITNPSAALDLHMGETLMLQASSGTHRIDGVLLLGDGAFGNLRRSTCSVRGRTRWKAPVGSSWAHAASWCSRSRRSGRRGDR